MPRVALDGFTSVPPGRVATIVTSLEMTSPPSIKAEALKRVAGELVRVDHPGIDWYRRLFRTVGEDWLWFSRLRMARDELAAVIHDPAIHVYVLRVDSCEAGFLELDFREIGQCEIAFFGLVPNEIGKGLGAYLMREAITRAWNAPIQRLWMHTCTLDHPSALAFYRRAGFRPYRQQVEIAADPRVNGELPRSAGAHVPIFDR